jgi:spore maturation protein CgeB/SAM-dependent methyltransferase
MHDDHDHDHGLDESGNPWPDRVNEAYYNKMGEEFGARTRERINWMCSQAAGESALDVGCSQGIASILMAREGLRVLGIDIDPATLRYAEGERAKEIASVRERLEFRCCELAALGGDELFDTVILGEVVEHQTNAVRFIRQAAARVAPEGRLVVTVPFGLHPWPDHKCSVFPSDVVEAVRDAFAIRTLDVVAGYVRMVAQRSASPGLDADAVIAATQKGTVESQEKYFETARREQAAAKAGGVATAEASKARDALQKLQAELASRQDNAAQLQAQLTRLQAQETHLQAQLAGVREDHAAQMQSHAAQLQAHAAQLQAQKDARDALEQAAARHLLDRTTMHDADRVEMQQLRLSLDQARGTQLELEQARLAELRDWVQKQAAFEQDIVRLKDALSETKRIRETAQALQKELDALKSELAVAQTKRAGHFQHLQAERDRSSRLIAIAQSLHDDNERYRQSLALALGQAIFDMRTLRGLLGFPRSLVSIARRWRRRGSEGVVLQPLSLPPLRAVVLPGAAAGSAEGSVAPSTTRSAKAEANALSVIGWNDDAPTDAVRMMSVLDEFSRACFAPQAALVEPRPDNFEGLLDAAKPRLLFVESCWKGNHGTWQYRVAGYANPPGRELPELVAACKARGIPTVFWNKEDPVHFDNFIDNAKHFDCVLTTAAEAMPKYAERTSARVGVLQFAAEETLHNPVDSSQRNGRVCFAGSYYATRFEDRRNDQRMLLEAASKYAFDIYDRNHDPKASAPSDFAFPGDLARFVRGRLPYAEMGKAYRSYSVFLNVNSVVDSPTMFSRRVFELLACGTPVVSTWSRGTEETFGKDLVWHVRDREEAEYAIGTLLSDPREWRRRSLAGIRAVLGAHTFRHRFAQLLEFAGVEDERTDPLSDVLVVAQVRDQRQADAVAASFARQRMDEGVRTRLLVVPQGGVDVALSMDGVEIAHGAQDGLGAIVRRAGATGAVSVFSPEAVYGAHHLQDLMHALRYSNAAVVGKPVPGPSAREYTFDAPLHPGSLVFAPGVVVADEGDALLRGEIASVLGQHRTFAADSANFQLAPEGADAASRDALRDSIEI